MTQRVCNKNGGLNHGVHSHGSDHISSESCLGILCLLTIVEVSVLNDVRLIDLLTNIIWKFDLHIEPNLGSRRKAIGCVF